ncbi:MAG TPA: methylmalonyl-CoA epimerase [Bacteroidota bacterium]|nr:methylmalonyl-CoA epimerase [Bacteroidota bacterium]
MVGSVAHIGIAVKDLKKAVELYSTLFGAPPVHTEPVEEQHVNTAMFSFGGTSVELLESTAPDSFIARFIESRGEGMHHVSFGVSDIVAELARLQKAGFQLIDERPRKGADNCLVAFIHPKSSTGVLIELSQKLPR